jgi:hypothetical protein
VCNWKFLRCFSSRETCGKTGRRETNSHKSGGLVSVLASGTSAHPKNARDPTMTATNAGEDVEKKEPLYTGGGNAN